MNNPTELLAVLTARSQKLAVTRRRTHGLWQVPDLACGQDLAEPRERPLVVRQYINICAQESDGTDLGPRPAPFTFAWADRDEPLEIVAAGAVLIRQRSGLAATYDPSLRLVEEGRRLDLPLWVGGAAFETGRAPAGTWSGWPTAALWVPRFVRVDRGAGQTLVSHVLVGPERTAGELAAQMQHERRQAERWLRALSHLPRPVVPAPAPRADEAEQVWQARVSSAVAALQQASAEKVVLARAADVIEPGLDVGATLTALRAAHPQAFCFAIRVAAPGTFLGATPELLVRRSGGELVSEALAGTVARDETDATRSAARLLASRKDRHEHALVLQHVLATLRTFGTGVVHDARPDVLAAGNVLHLRTAATTRADAELVNVVEALHPTPAVGGLPVEAAARLRHDEPLERGWYAAPIGWLDAQGDGVFAVALRSALVNPTGARLFAGAGIVAASDPQAEWQETELKLQAMRDALRKEAG